MLMWRWMRCLVVVGFAAGIGCGERPAAAPAPASPPPAQAASEPAKQESQPEQELSQPEKLSTKHLPNAVRVHTKVISGGLPDGAAGFAELQALGVKTVISVDAAKPDVALAEKHGLRYVHLPHSYDGIPDQRALELAKAVSELPGPIYIHCHHGKHRSPAAAAVACLGAGMIDRHVADQTLEIAGTSPNYRGLYQATAAAQKIEAEKLAALPANFPATVEPSPMEEAMGMLEHTHDHVKQLAANDWKMLAKLPDLDAPHEALLLREHYTEMLRTDETRAQPEEFQQLMREGEAAALALEQALNDWHKAGRPAVAPAAAKEAFEQVTKNCKACHERFRDVPLSEKQK